MWRLRQMRPYGYILIIVRAEESLSGDYISLSLLLIGFHLIISYRTSKFLIAVQRLAVTSDS